MSGSRAKRLRRENPGTKRKQFFKPVTVPIPSGKIDKDGNQEMVETYIPRTQRRKIMRMFKTDLRKGRINLEDIAKAKHDRHKHGTDV